jgi:hypothetical protein
MIKVKRLGHAVFLKSDVSRQVDARLPAFNWSNAIRNGRF